MKDHHMELHISYTMDGLLKMIKTSEFQLPVEENYPLTLAFLSACTSVLSATLAFLSACTSVLSATLAFLSIKSHTAYYTV